MRFDELNALIKNYIENDKTGMAMMLTAPWGYGKSYYIKETLTPFLLENNHKCVVVSLYGLKNIQEISKQIYLSLRTIRLSKDKEQKSEVKSTAKIVGKVIGKTIFNTIVSNIGLDIYKLEDEDFQDVYESINLTGMLIVLEDIERSKISIVEILGYVNNLTEQDNVRVLLVANEDELIKKKTENDQEGYSEDVKTYLSYKEKTIGDTIQLCDEQSEAITNILGKFTELNNIFIAQDVERKIGRVNLRTFTYACQKSDELLRHIGTITFDDSTHMLQFQNCVFFGVLRQAIALSQNYDQACKWKGGKYYLGEEEDRHIRFLGATHQKQLLFKFCFDYLINHDMPSKEMIQQTYKAYEDYCLFEVNQTADDKDLGIIKNYYVQTEEEVRSAVVNITHRLENERDIPFMVYGDLARILIRIKYDLGIEIEECKRHIVDNLKGISKNVGIDLEAMFAFGVGDGNVVEQAEYQELKEAMISSLYAQDNSMPYGFDYEPEHIKKLELQANKRNIKEDFIGKLDIERLKNTIDRATAKQLDDLRLTFFAAYRSGVCDNQSIYYPISENDRLAMKKLIKHAQKENKEVDKVKILQLNMLAENLTEMINS